MREAPKSDETRLRVVHVIAPASFGGAESVVSALATGRMDRGGPTEVVALLQNRSADSFVAQLRAEGVPVHEIRCRRRRYLAEAGCLAETVREIGARVLHTHNYHADFVGYLAGRRCDVPMVSTVHGFSSGDVKNRFYEWCDRKLLHRFDGVICVAHDTRARVDEAGISDRFVTIPNGFAPIEVSSAASARDTLGVPQDCVAIGWVGRLNHEKAPELFVEAMAALRQMDSVRGFLIGEGLLRSALAEQIGACGLDGRVVLLGAHEHAAGLLSAFDVLALTSRTEGMPMVLLEAMAAGVPVVSFGVGGIPEILDEETGWVVPPGDVAALGRVLKTVLTDAQEARRRALRARAVLLDCLNVDRWLDCVEEVYRTVAQGRA